jgi:hypothetical protein
MVNSAACSVPIHTLNILLKKLHGVITSYLN